MKTLIHCWDRRQPVLADSTRRVVRLISVPKGVLRLAALKMFSESSLSGTGLAEQIRRVTGGEWNPGPGSIYLILGELLKKGMITELPKREGNVRRYIISSKGKEELARLAKETESDVARQLRLLAVYSSLAGRAELKTKVMALANTLGRGTESGKA
ncbi:MAG: PadR family transcriptional regulator [Thaumarchaeota archaeon]|nr:PadR family transcriptional regulator [Nitrososphaerota archaeon]